MDEEKQEEQKTEEKKPEDDATNEDEGSKPTTTPLIDIANAAAERMEKANTETARLQEVQAERDARIALGGRSEAGGEAVKPKEETDEEYAARFEAGKVDLLK